MTHSISGLYSYTLTIPFELEWHIDLYDKQFCNGDFVFLANSHKLCLQIIHSERQLLQICM